MADEKVTLLFRSTGDSSLLRALAMTVSPGLDCLSVEGISSLSSVNPPDVLIIEQGLADFASLQARVSPRTAVLLTGRDDWPAADLIAGWPRDFYADFAPYPVDERTRGQFLRALHRALDLAGLRAEVNRLAAQNANQDRVKQVYSEIREIKSFINDNVVKELEKRVALQVRYLWFQRRKQKIEDILRKVYIANDVSSLLDTVYDIKELVQASGVTFYILDQNETLGKYLKPLVWDDAFLSHNEFSRYIALLDSQDFAAQVVRLRDGINLADALLDRRPSKRYVEHLKKPLRSLLAVPIMHEKEVIGVLEVYNKLTDGEVDRVGFSREDQQVLRGLSEHISLAMTKLNLIQYDALTGLLRPDPFFEKAVQKINQRSKRRQEIASYAMVMGDVDWFKQYNDRNGHEAGNRLLRQLAGVLKSSIREEDLICRYGGEEFLFFLTGVNSLEEACVLTERIRKNVETRYFESEEFQPRNNLTMSFGVTLLPRQEEFLAAINRYELRKIASEADMALSQAKGKRFYGQKAPVESESNTTKNKVCVYQREQRERDKAAVIEPFRQEFFEEKRRDERHYISTLLLYQENGHFKVTKTINVSLGGVRIFSDSKLPLAKALDLFLILENRAASFKGDVVYSQKTADEPVEYHTGIMFRQMAAAERQALEEFLASVSKREAAS